MEITYGQKSANDYIGATGSITIACDKEMEGIGAPLRISQYVGNTWSNLKKKEKVLNTDLCPGGGGQDAGETAGNHGQCLSTPPQNCGQA